MSTTGFNRDTIIELLTELGRLSAKGVAGRLYVVAGTAMALEFDTRRVTADIDAIFHPPTTVADEAASMTTDLALSTGWLSSAAQAFIPLPDADPVSLGVEGLQIALCSPANLLAMKMAAERPHDITDLGCPVRAPEDQEPAAGLDMAERIYGPTRSC